MAYKKTRKPKSTKLIIKDAPLMVDVELSEENSDELLDILTSIPFNKISIPLNAYRKDVLDEPNNEKSLTVGFIKGYNPDEYTFTVVVFDTFKEAVEKFANAGVKVDFSIWKDHVTKINKLSLMEFKSVEVTE